ncbi:hypothetical protein [Roseovarius sp. Pro17]|uniref:hypothetical protein n=1 Tax=Roseovarius sp. Pro17 TaxID=3108175 RepID=UPI002D7675ED|nr:hypothetical protein [Roseovarius sp. Pro17]
MSGDKLDKGRVPHQPTTDRERRMTTAQGGPIAVDQNSLTAGPRSPVLRSPC